MGQLLSNFGVSVLLGLIFASIVYTQLTIGFFIKKKLSSSGYSKVKVVLAQVFIGIAAFAVLIVVVKFTKSFLSTKSATEGLILAVIIGSVGIYGIVKASRLVNKQSS